VFIKRTTKRYKGKTYVNHLLVESLATPKGPRHRVICALGALAPAPREEWLALAHKIAAALEGQATLFPDEQVETIVAQVQTRRAATPPTVLRTGEPRSLDRLDVVTWPRMRSARAGSKKAAAIVQNSP